MVETGDKEIAEGEMDKIKVSYLSECDRDYVTGLKNAQTLDALNDFVTRWRFLANDAYKSVKGITFDRDEFAKGRAMESRDEYVGDAWATKYGAVLIPELLMRVSIYAMEFGAPRGVTCIRLREFGRIIEGRTCAKWVESPASLKQRR